MTTQRRGGRIPPGGISRLLSERDRQGNAVQGGGQNAAGDIATRLRGLFDQLGEAVSALSTQDDASLRKEGEIPFSLGGKAGRAVFGYTVKMGLDGLKAERFGDLPPTPGANAHARPAPRAPIADVFEENDGVRIVAELPGVAAADIRLALQANQITIATDGKVHYEKTITLPFACDPARITQSCSNGILEILLTRALPA